MRCSHGLRVVSCLFLLFSPAVLSAKAEEEQEEPLSVYLVLEEADAANDLYVSRFLLPSSLSLYAWSTFEVNGGIAHIEGEGSFRIRSRDIEKVEDIGGYSVLRYDFLRSESQDPSLESRPDGGVLKVSFSFSDLVDGEAIVQPPRRAVLMAIGRSGARSGSVRLLSLRYGGGGRFDAEAVIR